MLGVDASERKAAVDTKLELEEESLGWLKSKMIESGELTSGMVDILTSFEHRLAKLESTIEPVYDETKNLQRRQENIDLTLDSLDHVIAFYNVSKEVEAAVVREGPNNLQVFLQAMSRLKGALDYFEKNNPQSIELENVKSLYQTGGNALSREFSELVKKHSKPIAPIDLLNWIVDDNDNVQHFPEDVQTALIQMAEWLNLNDHDEFMHIYATVRGSVAKKSLDNLRDHQKSSSNNSNKNIQPPPRLSPNLSRKFGSPLGAADSSSSKVSRISSTINRRLSTVSNRLEAATGYTLNRRSNVSSSGGGESRDTFMEVEVDSFARTLTALQRIMSGEQLLLVGIIPGPYRQRIFEMIIRDSMEVVLKDADLICGRVKKGVNNNDFFSIITLFLVIRHLVSLG